MKQKPNEKGALNPLQLDIFFYTEDDKVIKWDFLVKDLQKIPFIGTANISSAYNRFARDINFRYRNGCRKQN